MQTIVWIVTQTVSNLLLFPFYLFLHKKQPKDNTLSLYVLPPSSQNQCSFSLRTPNTKEQDCALQICANAKNLFWKYFIINIIIYMLYQSNLSLLLSHPSRSCEFRFSETIVEERVGQVHAKSKWISFIFNFSTQVFNFYDYVSTLDLSTPYYYYYCILVWLSTVFLFFFFLLVWLHIFLLLSEVHPQEQ